MHTVLARNLGDVTMGPEQYLTVPQLAERLAISRETAYRLCRPAAEGGRIPATRIGRLVRVRVADADAFERACREDSVKSVA